MAKRKVNDLKTKLKSFIHTEKKQWDKLLNYALFAIRTTLSTTTGFSPSYLMYGKELRTPCQNLVIQNTTSTQNYHIYAEELDKQLSLVTKHASNNIKQSQLRKTHN